MNWWILLVVALAPAAGVQPGIERAGSSPPVREFADEVRGVFENKCAVCHGPDLEKPQGRFGYVLDLPRMAQNPELVIPARPAESELWLLVQNDEMPPTGSPHGSLAPVQKEAIRSWIEAGAPDVSPRAQTGRTLRWLGRFHLLMLHFPIALVVAAGLGEIWSVWRRDPSPSESVRFCFWLGALAALPTAGLGWIHAAAGNGFDSSSLLTAHRWLGTTAAA